MTRAAQQLQVLEMVNVQALFMLFMSMRQSNI